MYFSVSISAPPMLLLCTHDYSQLHPHPSCSAACKLFMIRSYHVRMSDVMFVYHSAQLDLAEINRSRSPFFELDSCPACFSRIDLRRSIYSQTVEFK